MVGSGTSQKPVSGSWCGRLATVRTRRPSGRGSAWRRAANGRLHLPGPGHRGHRGVEGSAGERRRCCGASRASATGTPSGSCCTVKQRTEVVRDGVEAAGVHEPGAGLDGPVVVGQVHAVDELGLTGQVDVVGAGVRARRDQRLAVPQVGADRGRDHPGRLGDRTQGRRVAGVGEQQRQVGQPRVDRGQPGADLLEPALVAAGQRPAAVLAGRCGRGTRRSGRR